MFFRRLLGLGPTKKQKDQLNILKEYIVQNKVQLVENDTRYPFKQCTDFAKEKSSRPPLTNEYFLKVNDNKYAYLGNTSKLEFFPDHIGTQIGLNRLSQDYHEQLYNFLNNYLFIRVAPPRQLLPPEQRGLLQAFMQDAENRVQRSNEEAYQKQLEDAQNTAVQRRLHENDDDYQLRMFSLERKREQEQFLANCAVNFRTYLNSQVASGDFMNAYIGREIFNILVTSIGTEFEKRRLKLNDSQIKTIQNYYANHADTEQLKEQFIAYLCTTPENFLSYHTNRTKARVILERVYFPPYTSVPRYDVQGDTSIPNKLQALIWCLEYFEEFLLKQAHETRTQTQRTQTQGTQTQGGKSKSKSTRKKRFSHRKKKCHSHSYKHKRRAPNTKQYCH